MCCVFYTCVCVCWSSCGYACVNSRVKFCVVGCVCIMCTCVTSCHSHISALISPTLPSLSVSSPPSHVPITTFVYHSHPHIYLTPLCLSLRVPVWWSIGLVCSFLFTLVTSFRWPSLCVSVSYCHHHLPFSLSRVMFVFLFRSLDGVSARVCSPPLCCSHFPDGTRQSHSFAICQLIHLSYWPKCLFILSLYFSVPLC